MKHPKFGQVVLWVEDLVGAGSINIHAHFAKFEQLKITVTYDINSDKTPSLVAWDALMDKVRELQEKLK